MPDSLDRRNFLKLIGLTGVAGTVGCEGPAVQRQLVSLVLPDEQHVPGIDVWYTTSCRECPAGCGMKVRTREGRANKVEGNPEHPISQGGLCIRGQAGLQGLYNPDRVPGPFRRIADGATEPVGWDEAVAQLAARLVSLTSAGQGNRIAFLSGQNGDSLDHLIHRWMGALPSERYLIHEPFSYGSIREANRIAFNQPVIPEYRFAEADLLLSFGADFLETWLSPVGFSRSFSRMRTGREGNIGKIVQVEPRLSLTGANADEWFAVRPETEMLLALAMTRQIVMEGLGVQLSPAERRGDHYVRRPVPEPDRRRLR